MKHLTLTFFIFFAFSTPSRAADRSDVPVVEDGACEFGGWLWINATAEKHGLRTLQEMQAFGIQRAKERCKNGMTLMVSTLHSGVASTLEQTLGVARALCRVPDIQQTQRRAFDKWFITDVRCTISKLGDGTSPASADAQPPPKT